MKSYITVFAGIISGFVFLSALLLMFTEVQNSTLIVLMLFGITIFIILNLLLTEEKTRKRCNPNQANTINNK
jgi:hypothetical protein